MTIYQWAMLGLGALGFLFTWTLGWFGAGRVVEQMKAEVKKYVEGERDKIHELLKALEDKFEGDQQSQDRKFGEVGAAMRQYTADVEKQVRELEIWGRDNFVQKTEFERATETVREDIKDLTRSIKEDFKDLNEKIDRKQ